MHWLFMEGHITMARLRTKEDLVIYRDFDQEVFTQGEPEGPVLLLRKLRGEKADWAKLEEHHMPRRMCKGPCMQGMLTKSHFSAKE